LKPVQGLATQGGGVQQQNKKRQSKKREMIKKLGEGKISRDMQVESTGVGMSWCYEQKKKPQPVNWENFQTGVDVPTQKKDQRTRFRNGTQKKKKLTQVARALQKNRGAQQIKSKNQKNAPPLGEKVVESL